jgi:predicted nucleotidyltransferase
MLKYGLKDVTWDAIVGVLRGFPEVEEVLLYGSRATGRFRAGSDIDLAFVDDIDLKTLLNIDVALDDLLLPYNIDTIVLARVGDEGFKARVLAVGISIYSRDTALT